MEGDLTQAHGFKLHPYAYVQLYISGLQTHIAHRLFHPASESWKRMDSFVALPNPLQPQSQQHVGAPSLQLTRPDILEPPLSPPPLGAIPHVQSVSQSALPSRQIQTPTTSQPLMAPMLMQTLLCTPGSLRQSRFCRLLLLLSLPPMLNMTARVTVYNHKTMSLLCSETLPWLPNSL